MARVVRGPVLSVKEWDHVEAARSVGVSELTIVLRHVLPMVISPIVVATSLTLSHTIFTVTALSFLGLGPPPPDPNWGGMLSEARQFMELAPLTVVGPADRHRLCDADLHRLGERPARSSRRGELALSGSIPILKVRTSPRASPRARKR